MPKKLAGYQSGLVFLVVAAGFIALLFRDLGSTNRVECSLCVEFNGRVECTTGQGADQDAARESAQTVACAALGSGVNEAFRCSATPPQQLSCREL
jgi:hypothetical protein